MNNDEIKALELENYIDAFLINSKDSDKYVINVENLTLKIFEIIWTKYRNSGWTNISWDKENSTITLNK